MALVCDDDVVVVCICVCIEFLDDFQVFFRIGGVILFYIIVAVLFVVDVVVAIKFFVVLVQDCAVVY